jgi:superfamily II DNA or RNA helicase
MNVLFNYQVPVYTQRLYELEKYSESLMLMATGTGKTVVSAHIAKYYLDQGYRGLFLYNENEGLRQAEKSYRKIIGEDISYSRFYGQRTKEWNADQAQMMFASFQSLNNVHGKWYEIFSKDHFYFIVIDESHHDQAPTYKEVIDYFVGKKLRMTATPSDERVWNQVSENISLPKAIANGYLSQVEYHLLSDGIDTRKLKKICKDVLEGGKRIGVKQLNETIFVQKRTNTEVAIIKRRAGNKQTMIFCENIAHAKHVAKSFKQGTVGLAHSGLSEKINHEVLESFRNKKIQFKISVNKFNEAIDVPDAEVVVFLRATNSKRIFFQQLGRGLRKTEFKNKVIVLDFVGNVERLVMVTELGKEIREEAEKLGHNLSKDIFDIHGKYYDLNFTETVFKDILKVIEAINCAYMEYEELSVLVQSVGINSRDNYLEIQKNHLRWPTNPHLAYKDLWKDWYHFLGKKKISYLRFDELKKATKKNNIDGKNQYVEFQKSKMTWPSDPSKFYKEEWISWSSFLRDHPGYLTYSELKEAVLLTHITHASQYKKESKLNKSWPAAPDVFYKKEWISWYSFLSRFLTYEELAKEVKPFGFRTRREYLTYQKNKSKWPSQPNVTFRKDWVSWYIFLGKFEFYGDLKKKAISLKIKTQAEYLEAQKNRPTWPRDPHSFFIGKWTDWYDFLGKTKHQK